MSDFLDRIGDNIADAAIQWILTVLTATLVSALGWRVRRRWQRRHQPDDPPSAEEAPDEPADRIDRRQPRAPRPVRPDPARPNLEPLPGLVGRRADVDAVLAKIEGTEPWSDPDHERRIVVVVRGPRGIGSSWCAREAGRAIQRSDRFPDGVILVDLPAPTTRQRGLLNTVAHLAGLGDVDLADDAIGAADLSDRLRDDDLLVVVDNVDSRDDLAPLLQTDLHLLVAASPALHLGRAGAELHRLGPLAPDAAAAVFLRTHNRPLHDHDSEAARRTAAETITRFLGGRPGLIHEIASALEAPATQLAANLTAAVATPPFAAFGQTGEDSLVHQVCLADHGYHDLSEEARRTVRLLATTSCPLAPDALAVLLGPEATPPWSELTAHGFVRRGESSDDSDHRRLAPDVWRLARLHLLDEETDDVRYQAYARLVPHLGPQAAAAMTTLTRPDDPGRRRGRSAVLPFAGTATAWLTRHVALLHELAVAPAPPPDHVATRPPDDLLPHWFSLAEAAGVWYEHTDQPERAVELCTSVLATALAAGRRDVEGWAQRELGKLALFDDPPAALTALYTALDRLGHRGEAEIRTNIAAALLHRGHDDDVGEALSCLVEARPHLAEDDERGAGTISRLLGEASYRQAELRSGGDVGKGLAEAEHHLVQATDRLADRDPAGYAEALNVLVLVYTAQEAHGARPPHRHPRPGRDARRAGNAALAIYERRGDHEGQARARLNLAIVALTTPPPAPDRARTLLQANLAYLRGQPPGRLLARTLLYDGDAREQLGDDPGPMWREALEVAKTVGDTRTLAAAEDRLTRGSS